MKYFFALTLGITTLMACDTVNEFSTEKLPVVNVVESSQDSSIVRCTVADYIFEDEALTRTNLTPGTNGLSFSWNEETDKIGIFGNSKEHCSFYITTDGEGKTAHFTTEMFSLKAGVTYFAYNDCSQVKNTKNLLTLDYTGQRQTGKGTYNHLGNYDFMTASATPIVENSVAFEFNHVGTVLLVRCDIPVSDTYKSISIRTSSKSFVTKGTMNLTTSLSEITPIEKSNTMTLLLGEENTRGLTMSKADPLNAYFTIAPIDLSSETITVVLTSASGSTYVSKFEGKILEQGKAYMKDCWTPSKMTTLYAGTDRHSASEKFQTLLRHACSFDGVPYPTVVIDGGDNVLSEKYTNAQGQEVTNHVPSFSMQDVRDDVSAALSGISDYRFLATFATHDNGCERFPYNDYVTDPHYNDNFYSGPQEQDGYYTYGITGSQMCETNIYIGSYIYSSHIQDYYYDQNGKDADEAVAKFRSWIDALPTNDHKPIVVMSHIPMHMHRGDSYGGEIWVDALNFAADRHNVIFLWGHNHTIEDPETKDKENNQYDASKFVNYCLKPKDKITVQKKTMASESKQSVQKELKFHYLNAGYITWGFSSILTFIDDNNDSTYERAIFRKYDLNGNYRKGTLGGETVNNLKEEPYIITLSSFK